MLFQRVFHRSASSNRDGSAQTFLAGLLGGVMQLREHKTVLFGVLVGVFAWLLDSALDYYVFLEAETLIQAILQPSSMELWMRCLILVLIIGFSVYADITIRKLTALATHDDLTGIFNRRVFYQFLEHEVRRAKRYGYPLSVMMFDIDGFKRVNDENGHHEGDRILIKVCEVVNRNIRSSDIFARWGGDEFMILSGDTDIQAMATLAEKLRAEVEEACAVYPYPVTLSCGVAQMGKTDSEETLISAVDNLMYRAKSAGKNRVLMAV